jgi:RHS repeat-associated protein
MGQVRAALTVTALFLLTIVATYPASAYSNTENPQNPWYVQNAGYFSSPAEFVNWYIAGARNSESFILIKFIGPDTQYEFGYSCSPSNPCWNALLYSDVTSYSEILTWYSDTAPFGQLYANGTYSPQGQTFVAKSEGQSACTCQVADPIDVGSGNVFESFVDYASSGQNPIQFIRYYNSRPDLSSPATFLGTSWRSNFDRYIRIMSSSTVIAERPDGRELTFTLSGGTWVPDSDVDVILTNTGSVWTLIDHDDAVESYTVNSVGSLALLQTIQSRNGYTQSLSYNSNGQLATVTDSYSRSLTFNYSGGLLQSVLTPDNTTVTLGYTPVIENTFFLGNQLTTATYSTTPASTQTYSYTNSALPFAMTGITDENGNSFAAWSYDGWGRGLTSQHGNGVDLTTVTYNDTDGSRTVTNALGVTDAYTFTLLQNVPKVTGISRAATATTAAATESFAYDASGFLQSATDWNGNQTTYTNDVHGDPTIIAEPTRTTTISYDPTFVHLPHQIVTTGLTTTLAYDASGNLHTRTDTDTTTQKVPYSTKGQTRTWTYTWNNFLLASVQNPRTDVTAITNYGYDSTGALTSITDALSHPTSITQHTGGGRPLTVVDPNNVTTNITYDARQRLTSVTVNTAAGALATNYTIDPAGELTKVTLADNSYLQYGYDTAHRVIQATDAQGNYIQYTPDALGDITALNNYNNSNVLSYQHSATFDALGRRLTDVGGMNQTTTYTYDSDGNALTILDPLKNKATQVFDSLNRLTKITDANKGVTQFSYDTHDRTTKVTDANTHATSFVYDGFGDAIEQKSPDSGATIYYYDGDANLTKKIDALNVTTNYTYDKLDRILTRAYPADSTQNVAYTYDQTGTGFGFGVGRLTSLTDPAGSLTISYDERGNVLTNQRVSGSTTLNTAYSYDNASRITGIAYPSGMSVSYSRDSIGNIVKTSVFAPGSTTAQTLATSSYEPFGPVTSLAFGNNESGTLSYDLDYRMTEAIDKNSASHSLTDLKYGYDAANNVKTITDKVTAANNQALGYDVLNRLTTGRGSYGSYTWKYDKLGNLTSLKIGTVTTTYGYATGGNRLSTIGTTAVATNANGNITSIPPANGSAAATFTYNVANRLQSVTGTTLAISNIVYDGFGQRFSKQDSGSNPITYAYDLSGNLLEENNNGSVTDYVYLGGTPLGLFVPGGTNGTLYYVHSDRLNTPQLVTNSSQTSVWGTTYQPYGTTPSIVSGITQNLRLPGQNIDAETGFYYNLNRDYMPNIGRYLETDPIGLGGGLNTYAYGKNNPLKFTDRSGKNPVVIAVGVGVFAAGAYAGYINSPQHPYTGAFIGGSAAVAALFAAPEVAGAYVEVAATARMGQTAQIAAGTFGAAATVATATGGTTVAINYLNDRPWDTDLGKAEAIALGAGIIGLDIPVIGALATGEGIAASDAVFSGTGTAILGTWATTLNALWGKIQEQNIQQRVNCP